MARKDGKEKMSKKAKFNGYEITPLTMAVLSKEDKNGSIITYVIEEYREYTVHFTPTKIIDHACRFFGSSLEGRLEGTKDISQITHKAPVAIDPSSGMYFFPTASPKNKKCSWIAHSHILFIKPVNEARQTEIQFKNGKRTIINVSYGSMLNQKQRTAQFRYSLDSRMEVIKDALLLREKLEEEDE